MSRFPLFPPNPWHNLKCPFSNIAQNYPSKQKLIKKLINLAWHKLPHCITWESLSNWNEMIYPSVCFLWIETITPAQIDKGTWSSKPTYSYAIGAEPQLSFCYKRHLKKRIPIFYLFYSNLWRSPYVCDFIRHENTNALLKVKFKINNFLMTFSILR